MLAAPTVDRSDRRQDQAVLPDV